MPLELPKNPSAVQVGYCIFETFHELRLDKRSRMISLLLESLHLQDGSCSSSLMREGAFWIQETDCITADRIGLQLISAFHKRGIKRHRHKMYIDRATELAVKIFRDVMSSVFLELNEICPNAQAKLDKAMEKARADANMFPEKEYDAVLIGLDDFHSVLAESMPKT